MSYESMAALGAALHFVPDGPPKLQAVVYSFFLRSEREDEK